MVSVSASRTAAAVFFDTSAFDARASISSDLFMVSVPFWIFLYIVASCGSEYKIRKGPAVYCQSFVGNIILLSNHILTVAWEPRTVLNLHCNGT